jgi:hypothetical protein
VVTQQQLTRISLLPVVTHRTGTETLQLWDWLAATVEDATGGDTAVADLAEARQMAAAAAGASSAAALFGEVGEVQIECVL